MAEVGQLRRCSWGSRLGALFIAALTGVTVRAANPSDEVGEYYLDAEGVKHYYVFWDKSTSSYN